MVLMQFPNYCVTCITNCAKQHPILYITILYFSTIIMYKIYLHSKLHLNFSSVYIFFFQSNFPSHFFWNNFLSFSTRESYINLFTR